MKYTERELAAAIQDLLEAVGWNANAAVLQELCDKHPCIEEINLFGKDGPTGQGLGKFGGHAP